MLWTAFVNVDKLGIVSIEENSFSKKGKSHLYRPVAAEIHKNTIHAKNIQPWKTLLCVQKQR